VGGKKGINPELAECTEHTTGAVSKRYRTQRVIRVRKARQTSGKEKSGLENDTRWARKGYVKK